MQIRSSRIAVPLVALCALLACAAPPASPANAPSSGGQASVPPQRKAITIALQAEINALTTGLNQAAANSPPSRYFHEFTNSYLSTRDPNDEVRPLIAAELPTVDNGGWKVLDDGRMDVTWKLRQDVKWHDGRPLTSDDLKFGWEAAKDPITQLKPQGVASLIESADTPDPYTVVFHWRRTSWQGGEMGEPQLDPLPRHVLEEALTTNKENFSNHPYFATPEQFVGSGPFVPVAWERGSEVRLVAFDQYFLGRPRLDQVTVKFIRDAQTWMANLLAGSVDISYQEIGFEQARLVREEWAKNDGGTVELQLNHVRHLLPQLRQEYASPADLTNVQVRRAMMYALDRAELADAILPGVGQPANSITYPTSAIGQATAQRVISYPYDPARAAALFEEAGWRKGPDGILQKGADRFMVEYRSSGATLDAGSLFAPLQQQWLRTGVDAQFHEVATTNTPADTAIYPGVWFTSVPPDSLAALTRFMTRQIAAPENRYAAANRNGYSSQTADRFLDAIDTSLKMDDRARNWGELWRTLTDDVALFPMYYFPAPYVVRSRVTGALPANPLNPPTYQLQLWDVK